MKEEEIQKLLGKPNIYNEIEEISKISQLNFIYLEGIESLDNWLESNKEKSPLITKLHKYPLGYLLFVKTEKHKYFKGIFTQQIQNITINEISFIIEIQTGESLFKLKPINYQINEKNISKLITFFHPIQLINADIIIGYLNEEVIITEEKLFLNLNKLNQLNVTSIRKSGEKLMKISSTLLFTFLTNIVFWIISSELRRSVSSENDLKILDFIILIWVLINLYFFFRLYFLFKDSGQYLEKFYKDNLPNRKEEKL